MLAREDRRQEQREEQLHDAMVAHTQVALLAHQVAVAHEAQHQDKHHEAPAALFALVPVAAP